MAVSLITSALEFVANTQLPAASVLEAAPGPPLDINPFSYAQTKLQALIVGSEIISFVQGVTPERRQDLVNASTLAQLVAKKKVHDPADIYAWYDAYFDVLMNIGWVIQDRQFTIYKEDTFNAQAHEAILKVAAGLLAGNVGAMLALKATLDAVTSLREDSPWITLFNRESRSAHAAHFQISLAEQTPDGQFIVSLMAFGLEANSELTQVLFFKFHSEDSVLKHYSSKVTVNESVLTGVREAVAKKISAHASKFVKALPDLD
jgi:hypothetical protein